ncbi:MAG TPA: phosphoserine transaminase [Actinomycetota bacterium]|nr:phosphoserine transaminase [Actinomycetota bacterium]
MDENITIPEDLLPHDGRFGSGPSKVRPEALHELAQERSSLMGTSHRQAPVRTLVARLKEGLAELFGLPPGYEVVLGLGGATLLWDALAYSFIEHKSQHVVIGEFSARFAETIAAAPHLAAPELIEAPFGTAAGPHSSSEVDVYALIHNETSTGVCLPVHRVDRKGLVVVDATSAAGGMLVDPLEFDVYYFSPQKCFASDGGLWVALCSEAAVERIASVTTGRYVPPSLDLGLSLVNSRKNQTYNTPALATLLLMLNQIEWMLAAGGLAWAAGRCLESSSCLYSWAERSLYARPFVVQESARSPVVGTVDFEDSVDAAAVARILRRNGIVDTEPYRKLGRNQLRIGMYPAVEPSDVERLTRCVDFVVGTMHE